MLKPLFLFKVFGESKYRDEFNSGNLYLNTVNWYAQNENQRGTPIGDEWEGRVLKNFKKIYLTTPDDELIVLEDSAASIGVPKFDEMPVLCMSYIPEKWKWKINMGEKYYGVLDIDKEHLYYMKNQFGNYVSLYRYDSFFKLLKNHVEINSSGVTIGSVKYFDNDLIIQEKLQALNSDRKLDFLFIKNEEYSDEKEIRVVFHKEENYVKNRLRLEKPIEIIEEVTTIDDMIRFFAERQFSIKKSPEMK